MRALLLYPSLRKEIIGYGDLGAIAEPLALEYLAAGALEDSHEVRILDLRLHPDDLETTLADFQPDLVGVTGYSMHVLRNLALCRRVKELLPTCWTVVGGHHSTPLRPKPDHGGQWRPPSSRTIRSARSPRSTSDRLASRMMVR